ERVRARLHDPAHGAPRRRADVPHPGGARHPHRRAAGKDACGRGEPRFREGGGPARRHQAAAWDRAGLALAGPEDLARGPSLIESGLKKLVFEVQEYVRLIGQFFQAAISPPIYRYDIVEQFDAIGVASLTVVLLTGFFTGAVLALQSGQTLDQFGARPVVGR